MKEENEWNQTQNVYDDNYVETPELYKKHSYLGTRDLSSGAWLENYFVYGPFTNTRITPFYRKKLYKTYMDLARFEGSNNKIHAVVRFSNGEPIAYLPDDLSDRIVQRLESGFSYKCDECIPPPPLEENRIRLRKILSESDEEKKVGLGLVSIPPLSDSEIQMFKSIFSKVVLPYPLCNYENYTSDLEKVLQDYSDFSSALKYVVYDSIHRIALRECYNDYIEHFAGKNYSLIPYNCKYRVFKLKAVLTSLINNNYHESKIKMSYNNLLRLLEKLKSFCSQNETVFVEPIVKEFIPEFATLSNVETEIGIENMESINDYRRGTKFSLRIHPDKYHDPYSIGVFDPDSRFLDFIWDEELAEDIYKDIKLGKNIYSIVVGKKPEFKTIVIKLGIDNYLKL